MSVDKEHFKTRRVSPGCRHFKAVTQPRANYRESTASRLRQEIKGMTVTGFVRSRSKSLSPKKRSANSSPSSDWEYQKISQSQRKCVAKPKSSSTLKFGSLKSDSGSLARRQDSEKTIELITPARSMSETSNSQKETTEKCKIPPGAVSPSGYVVNTRSKTLSSLSVTSNEKEVHNNSKKHSQSNINTTPPANPSGYGKPLVTPVKQRLAIRRDFSLQGNPTPTTINNNHNCTVKTSIPRRVKSPILNDSSKLSVRPPFNNIASRCNNASNLLLLSDLKVDILSSVVIHIILLRLVHIASRLLFKTWPCAIAFIALGIVFWTATAESSSANYAKLNGPSSFRREEKSFGVRNKTIAKPQKPPSSPLRGVRSPQAQRKIIENKPQDIKSPANRTKIKPMKFEPQPVTVDQTQVSRVSPTRSSFTKIPKKITSIHNTKSAIGSTASERLKQQFCRDTPVYAAGRPNSIHSKVFKPQLEDIKSSYLLLNKQQQDRANRLKSGTNNDVPKPKKLDETERKDLLNLARKKFKSSGFFNDSKYDKIEGLNWISWHN